MSGKLKIIIFLFLVLLSLEIYLRVYWGFCDMTLMRADDHYEYIAQPDQDRFRLRNHIRYNEYSMRSKPLAKTDKVRILGFGDSILNGGAYIDQDSLATTIIEDSLSVKYQMPVRCLNISASSWGPDNCYAYLQQHGDFDASLILLVVNSIDAYDTMDFRKVVDVTGNYRSKQYPLAITELVARYTVPAVKRHVARYRKKRTTNIRKKKEFNPGFENFHQYSIQNQIPLIIYLHPMLDEVKKNTYSKGGEQIIGFCRENNIPLIAGLDHGMDTSMYRDDIHIDENGQKVIARLLMEYIGNNYSGIFR